jgi:predicted small lipoprotein YifL
MKLPTSAFFAALAASLSLTACGPTEAPKATSAAAPAASATAATKSEDKPEANDGHGMPGMADLFKGDPKAEEKSAEKANTKPAEKAGEKK